MTGRASKKSDGSGGVNMPRRNRRANEITTSTNVKACEVCGKEPARFEAPNGQLVCETDLAGLKALDQALREAGLL
jgi:hypothetical protein